MTRPTITEIRPHIRSYAELTSLEVELAKDRASLLVLPVGACEQHGDGLPLGTDNIRAAHVARAVVDRLTVLDERAGGDQGRAFVLPGIDYGVSPHHRFLPGTINIGPQLFIDLVAPGVHQLADA